MSLKHRSVLLAAMLASSTTAVVAQDRCADILANGFWDIDTKYGSTAHRNSVRTWFCKTGSSKTSFGGFATVPLGDSGMMGKFSSNFSDSRSKARCESSEKEDGAFQEFYGYLKTVNPEVVQAWQACMDPKNQGPGFFATLRTTPDPDQLQFNVAILYKPLKLTDPGVKVVIEFDEKEGSCEKINDLVKGQRFVKCKLAPKSKYMQVDVRPLDIPHPDPLQFGIEEVKIVQPEVVKRTEFFPFGEGVAATVVEMKDKSYAIMAGNNRSAYAVLSGKSVLVTYKAWPLGVGILLPDSTGVYWPTRKEVWSHTRLTADKVQSALAGKWVNEGNENSITLAADGKLMVKNHIQKAPAQEMKLLKPLLGKVAPWNLTATIMPDMKTIIWSNNTVWHKRD